MGEYVALAAGVARAMMLSRALGPEGIGQLALVRQVLIFGSQVASLGLPMASVFGINKQKRDPATVLKTSLLVCGVTSILTGIVILLLFTRATGFFGQLSAPAVAACVAFVPLLLAYLCVNHLNIAKMRGWSIVATRILPEVLLTIVIAALYFPGALRVNLVIVLDVLLPAGGLLVGYLTVRRLLGAKGRFDWDYLRSAVPLGVQISAAGLLFLLNSTVSFVILRAFQPRFDELGHYGTAVRVGTLVVLAADGFLRLLYSRWASLEGEQRRQHVQRTISVAILAAVIGCVVVFALARLIVVILFGEQFTPAVLPTRILLVGVVGFLLTRVFQQLFIADGKPYYNIITLSCGVVTNAGLCLLLVRDYGKIGAAIAGSASYWVMAGVALHIGRTRYRLGLRTMLLPSREALMQVFRSLKGSEAPKTTNQDQP